jgi:hypothetical protein
MSSIPDTFDFEAPAFRRVGLPTLPPVNLAMMATALLPPRATSAQPVDCNPVARDFTSEGLFSSTQEVSIANLRDFALGLKNDKKRKYEGVSAAEESNIRGAQFRTVASVKSKEKAYKDCMNEMANTKIYKSLGSLQKNPSFDPSISYNFVPELEFGFIIAVRGVREEAKWIIISRRLTQFLILYKRPLLKTRKVKLLKAGVLEKNLWAYQEYELSTISGVVRKLFTKFKAAGIMYEKRDFLEGEYIL